MTISLVCIREKSHNVIFLSEKGFNETFLSSTWTSISSSKGHAKQSTREVCLHAATLLVHQRLAVKKEENAFLFKIMNIMHNSGPPKETNEKKSLAVTSCTCYMMHKDHRKSWKHRWTYGRKKSYPLGANFNQAYQVISSNSSAPWWSLSAGNLLHLHSF